MAPVLPVLLPQDVGVVARRGQGRDGDAVFLWLAQMSQSKSDAQTAEVDGKDRCSLHMSACAMRVVGNRRASSPGAERLKLNGPGWVGSSVVGRAGKNEAYKMEMLRHRPRVWG